MANNNVPTSRKSNVNIILAASGWAVIFTALAVAAGFYAGYQYREGQVKHDAQIIKAATATPAPAPAAEFQKN
jgi:uncharacterized protein HemX